MEENFDKIYDETKSFFKDEFKPITSKREGAKITKIFVIVFFITVLKNLLGMFLDKESSIIILLLNLIIAIGFVVIVVKLFFYLNKKMNYWKFSFSFKSKVGKKFWNLVDNTEYCPERANIDKVPVQEALKEIYTSFFIIDIEDYLKSDDFNMYTIRINDDKSKRFYGILSIINKKGIKDKIQKYIDENDFSSKKDIYKIECIDNKTYILYDVCEVFKFNDDDFFNKQELFDDYVRYIELKEIIKNI